MRSRHRGDAEAVIYPPNPVVGEMVAWVADFEAGRVAAEGVPTGVLQPGERLAIVLTPVTAAVLALGPVPTVSQAGATGTLVATDRRVLLLPAQGDAEPRSWSWASDVGEVTPLRDGLGVCWTPSAARHAAGVRHIEGLVVPELTAGGRPAAHPGRFVAFGKVQAAWRASQPGGADLWLSELRQRFRA